MKAFVPILPSAPEAAFPFSMIARFRSIKNEVGSLHSSFIMIWLIEMSQCRKLTLGKDWCPAMQSTIPGSRASIVDSLSVVT